MNRRPIALSLGIAAVAVFVLTGFQREYVMRSASLVDLDATPRKDGVVISGRLYASGARVARVTRMRNADSVLMRVYAAGIEATDDLATVSGPFAALIPLDPGVNRIEVGEDSRWLTIGNVHGIPVRVPRLRRDESLKEVVWRR